VSRHLFRATTLKIPDNGQTTQGRNQTTKDVHYRYIVINSLTRDLGYLGNTASFVLIALRKNPMLGFYNFRFLSVIPRLIFSCQRSITHFQSLLYQKTEAMSRKIFHNKINNLPSYYCFPLPMVLK
jgi:hypothetical protein